MGIIWWVVISQVSSISPSFLVVLHMFVSALQKVSQKWWEFPYISVWTWGNKWYLLAFNQKYALYLVPLVEVDGVRYRSSYGQKLSFFPSWCPWIRLFLHQENLGKKGVTKWSSCWEIIKLWHLEMIERYQGVQELSIAHTDCGGHHGVCIIVLLDSHIANECRGENQLMQLHFVMLPPCDCSVNIVINFVERMTIENQWCDLSGAGFPFSWWLNKEPNWLQYKLRNGCQNLTEKCAINV